MDPADQFLLQVVTVGHAGDPSTPVSTDFRRDYASLIRKLGAAGPVLLKNTDNYLPLTKPMNVGVFGNGAPYPVSGSAYLNDNDDPQGLEIGLLDIGGGSGSVRHTTLTSLLRVYVTTSKHTAAASRRSCTTKWSPREPSARSIPCRMYICST